MDIVFIENLIVPTVIGVYAWERNAPRNLELDLELGFDTRKAGASDDLHDALDYAAVAERIGAIAADSRYQLLEALAETIATRLMAEFAIPWLRLTMRKPGAVGTARNVGIVIERGQR